MKRPITPAMARKLRKLAVFLESEGLCIHADEIDLSINIGGQYTDHVTLKNVKTDPSECYFNFWTEQFVERHHQKFLVTAKEVFEIKEESYVE